MHPVGTKSAASFPNISAARRSNRFTVGSSPYTSSPTTASAIARRISGVGRVTVSLRKSTMLSNAVTSSGSLRIPLLAIVPVTMLFPSSLSPLRSPCPVCKNSTPNSVAFRPRSRSPHQFHKHLIRDTQPGRSKPHHVPAPLHQPRRLQSFESLPKSHPVLPLNSPHIDPTQLPQPQKQLLFQSTLPRHGLHLLRRQSPVHNRPYVRRRIVRVRPPLRPRKRMRPRPKSQISFPPPILQIVPRLGPRLRPIRNLIMVITQVSQKRASRFIKLRHDVIAWHSPRAVPRPTLQNLQPQPAPLVHLQQINRNMLRRELSQLPERLLPTLRRLIWQPGNQVKTNIPNPRVP